MHFGTSAVHILPHRGIHRASVISSGDQFMGGEDVRLLEQLQNINISTYYQ
jgi:hypothetical protein